MRVVVTGGTGFLGSAVVRALVAQAHDVVAIVRPSSDTGALEDLPDDRTVEVRPWTDDDALRAAFEGCEGLCHVAGAAGRFYPDPEHYERSNVVLTERVFTAASDAGVRRAVYTGTVAWLCRLHNDYAQSKLLGAHAARRIAGTTMDVVDVHPSGMIGPHDRRPTPMGRAIALFAAGGQRVVVGGGSGYIHVDDAAAGHVAALQRGDPAQSYVLDHEYWTIAELFEALARIVGRRPPWVLPVGLADRVARIVEPTWRALGKLPPINTFTTSYLALPRERHRGGPQSREALGLPEYRSIPQALEEAVDWFAEQGWTKATLATR